MSERISILDEIRSGGYEASLITTYNAYLPFYEDVVLRHLMSSGIRHNMLMMDAAQTSLAVERHPPRAAGKLYTLVPIKVTGAFHPKVILLVGKKKGTLLIGSHNLTLSGFGYNREMTNIIRCKGETDTEAAAVFGAVWRNFLGWAEAQAGVLPGHIIDMIKQVQALAPWMQKETGPLPENCRVLSAAPGAPALWQQLTDFAGAEPVSRITVSGAFFDANFSFIERVRDDLAPKEIVVGIDPASVQIPVGKKLPGVSFFNCSKLGAVKNDKVAGYLHAKSVFIQRYNGDTVLAVGSANPSHPAWLAPGMSQNVEMMIARKGTEADAAAEELGLSDIASMPPVTDDDWQEIRKNWEREDELQQAAGVSGVLIALSSENSIRFTVPGTSLPPSVSCQLFHSEPVPFAERQAYLAGSEFVLSSEGVHALTLLRFSIRDKNYTGLVQHVKQIEGLSRTDPQRRFNEALSSLSTSLPNIDHFVDCIREIIKVSDTVAANREAVVSLHRRETDAGTNQEGAELSIGLDEVVEQEHRHRQRLRGPDDLGYLLDVLLYNLRDETPTGLDDALEDRDAKGRSEEEQVDADDEDEVVLPPEKQEEGKEGDKELPHDKNPLDLCHSKVSSLVGIACDKLDALKQGSLEFPQLVIIMAGILSALRLLRGLHGKVPWIPPGKTAVPPKELRRLFRKIAEVVYDGDKSLISLDGSRIELLSFDEFARLKGLIIWLAWDSGITFADKKPFNESAEERAERFEINRLYVATAQLINGDEDVTSEARQSIGLLTSSNMDWLEKILGVDQLFRQALRNHAGLGDGSSAKAGDFGFNSLNPKAGIREILPRHDHTRSLCFQNSGKPKYVIPASNIRMIPFERILKAT